MWFLKKKVVSIWLSDDGNWPAIVAPDLISPDQARLFVKHLRKFTNAEVLEGNGWFAEGAYILKIKNFTFQLSWDDFTGVALYFKNKDESDISVLHWIIECLTSTKKYQLLQ